VSECVEFNAPLDT